MQLPGLSISPHLCVGFLFLILYPAPPPPPLPPPPPPPAHIVTRDIEMHLAHVTCQVLVLMLSTSDAVFGPSAHAHASLKAPGTAGDFKEPMLRCSVFSHEPAEVVNQNKIRHCCLAGIFVGAAGVCSAYAEVLLLPVEVVCSHCSFVFSCGF